MTRIGTRTLKSCLSTSSFPPVCLLTGLLRGVYTVRKSDLELDIEWNLQNTWFRGPCIGPSVSAAQRESVVHLAFPFRSLPTLSFDEELDYTETFLSRGTRL